MSELISVDLFEKIIGDKITLSITGWSAEGKVLEVKRLNHDDESTRIPFSVLFVMDQSEVLDQQIFTLNHKDLGEMAMFLVPLGPKHGGMCYEAVFT